MLGVRSRLGSSAAWRASWSRHADVLASQPDGGLFYPFCTFRRSSGVSSLLTASLYGRQPTWRAAWTRRIFPPLYLAKKGGTFVRKAFHSCGFSRTVLTKLQHLVAEDFVVVGYVMASVVITVCFREMLRDVCQKYSLPSPRYGIPVGSDGLISVYVEVEISRGDSVAETVRIWGYYNDLMAEKELLFAERRELMGNIEKCSQVFQRLAFVPFALRAMGRGLVKIRRRPRVIGIEALSLLLYFGVSQRFCVCN
uniref:Uncharacterized protein n=1 Tax=Ananas comosus var. bracteatus TaxID=296719 RepID=A0A6V7QMU9_ANACO|nr:unnamed protein product [Ananas comosus var. bracteatus]